MPSPLDDAFKRHVSGTTEGDDLEVLAAAYVGGRFVRERSERERSLPFDKEWLVANGFKVGTFGFLFNGLVFADPTLKYLPVYVGDCHSSKYLPAICTRGQMLDLLELLNNSS